MMKETKAILTAWKNTRVSKRIGTEYPHKSAVIQGARCQSDFRQYLTEEECNAVDKALLALKEDNYDNWVVVTAVYMRGFNCNKLANIVGIKKDKLYSMIDYAEHFIRGHIYHFFNDAA